MNVHQIIAAYMPPSEFFSKKPVTRRQYCSRVKRLLVQHGFTPVKAKYDKAGNCLICGEAGRCPGWHTEMEANRC